jgi:hypothetical protein
MVLIQRTGLEITTRRLSTPQAYARGALQQVYCLSGFVLQSLAIGGLSLNCTGSGGMASVRGINAHFSRLQDFSKSSGFAIFGVVPNTFSSDSF